MPLPTVAIVGRPNVGKSSLLNAFARRRVSIVDPRPGVTRDRVSAVVEHGGRYFEAVDTGGIGIIDSDHLEEHVEQQIAYAIQRCDVIAFVVDVQEGVTTLDETVARTLRRAEHPVLLVANKVDVPTHRALAGEFTRLGFGEPLCVSAKHFRGRTELLDAVAALLPADAERWFEPPTMQLAIVGKRNAGKSTFVNALAGEERVIVSEIPGTTRDAVDVRFEKDGRSFVAIDTAGVRKRSKMQDLEFYSHTRARFSIRQADVVMLLIDSMVPVADVDGVLARTIAEAHKPVVIAVNKWDLARDLTDTERYAAYLTGVLPEVDYAPIVFMTARDGKNIDAAVDVALRLHRQANTRIGTGPLNAALEHVLAERGPSAKRGQRQVKIYYATQVGIAPPTIVFFCNKASLVDEQYRRFMENRLRDLLPFNEIPMRLLFRDRKAEGERTAGAGSRKKPAASVKGARVGKARAPAKRKSANGGSTRR